MTDSNKTGKRPMFELPEEPKRRPSVKMPATPDLKPEIDDELPEGFENAVASMNMHQNNTTHPATSSAIPERNTVPAPVLVREEESIEEKVQLVNNKTAKDIIAQLKKKQRFEEIMLPSRNLTYEKYGLEPNQPIHVRPMTIEEEKIISTSRLIRSGQALDKIFDACIYENIPPGKLSSTDRVFLLFYIRGISYGPEYAVEVKCPSCENQFTEEINLDTLSIEFCDDDFNGEMSAVLPDSGLAVRYRVPTGDDERALSRHRDMKIRGGFDSSLDDSIVQRNIMLLTNIEGITDKFEIEQIVNNLGVKDSNFLREQVNDPGFGINTDINMRCEYCYHEWELDLPIDVNFFFPRTKRASEDSKEISGKKNSY